MTEPLTEADIVGTWAGLRPLVKAAASSERTADLSRRHKVHDVAERASSPSPAASSRPTGDGRRHRRRGRRARSARARPAAAPSSCALRGAEGSTARGRGGPPTSTSPAATAATAATCSRLDRRPTRARRAARAGPAVPQAEAVYAVAHEMARTLDDVLSRRTRARLLGPRRHAAAAPSDVAALIAPELGLGRGADRTRGRRRTGPRSTHERTAAGLPEHRARRDSTRAACREPVDSRCRPRRRTDAADRVRDAGRRRPRPRSTAARVEVDDALLRAARATVRRRCSSTPRRVAEASRDWWPLAMIWALDGAGRRRAAAVVARPPTPREVAAVLALCNDGARPGHRGRRPQRRVRRERARARRRGARPHRAQRASSTSTTTSLVVDVLPGTFGDLLEDDAARRARRHRRPLAAVDRPVDRRRLARLPRRRPALAPATGRSRTWSSASTSCSPTARAITHRRRAARRGRPRPHPAVRRLRGHARRHHRRPAAAAPGARRPSAARAYAFASFADGLDACRRILQRGATPAVLRLYDAIEADRSYQTGDDAPCCSCSTRATRTIVDATMARRRRGVRGRRAARRRRLVEQWLGHRNDVSALEALISRGLVVDTMEIAGAVARAAARSTSAATAAIRGGRRARSSASAHQSPLATPTARCLYFTFAGQPPADERDALLPRPCGTPGTRAVLARRRRAQPPPRRRPQPGRFVREALGAGFDVLAAVKAGARPERHPQPRQARPARSLVGAAGLAVTARPSGRCSSSTSGRHRSAPRSSRADATVAHEQHRELPPRLARTAGSWSSTPRAMATRASTPRAPRSTRTAGRSTRSASPTSAARRSCGTAPPASRSGPASAGRTSARSAVPRAPRRGLPLRAEPVGHQVE